VNLTTPHDLHSNLAMTDTSAIIKHTDHVILDQPLLRLPHELLRNNFRTAHFNIEKDSAGLKALLKDATTNGLNGRASPAEMARSLDNMIAQAKALRGKLAAGAEEEERILQQETARVAHMDELFHMKTFDDVKYEAWSRTRLDRLLIDYMLRQGCSESASMLATEKHVSDLVDVETLVAMNRIQASLKRGSVQEAITWCNANKKELRKLEVCFCRVFLLREWKW
jgi:macrophage erythroblast attacher